jgi:hypothetical protein
MKNILTVASATVFLLAGCAANPKDTLLTLNQSDAKYESPSCLSARQAALAYDDKVLSRMGMGFALGLLGPVGIIGAVALDSNQNKERERVNAVIQRECTTPAPAPPAAAPPAATAPANTAPAAAPNSAA